MSTCFSALELFINILNNKATINLLVHQASLFKNKILLTIFSPHTYPGYFKINHITLE